MRIFKADPFGKGRLALIVTGVFVMMGAGVSAHASSYMAEPPVTVTVDRPVIKSIADRENAIKDFRKVARRACKTSGGRGLSAMRPDEKCLSSLMDNYIYQIDKHCGGMKFAAKSEPKSET